MAESTPELNDEQMRRYARHIMLDELGLEGQQRICGGRALIIGMGGLGCPAALYLVSAGVGSLTLVDDDLVDDTNLQRQVLFGERDIGQPKALAAQSWLKRMRAGVAIEPVVQRADKALLDELVPRHDVVLDCSDNFATRHVVNRACVRHGRLLVSGSALRWDGQLFVSDQRTPGQACYACLFPEEDGFEETRCALLGVFAPLVGTMGTLQAACALQLIARGIDEPSSSQELMLWDGWRQSQTRLRVAPRPDCPVCGAARQTTSSASNAVAPKQ